VQVIFAYIFTEDLISGYIV